MIAITPDTGPGAFCGRVTAGQGLAHSFLLCLGFEAWLMSLRAPVLPGPTARSTVCTEPASWSRGLTRRYAPRGLVNVRWLIRSRAGIAFVAIRRRSR